MAIKYTPEPGGEKSGKKPVADAFLQIRIPADLRDAFKARCAQKGQAVSKVMRRFIEEYLK